MRFGGRAESNMGPAWGHGTGTDTQGVWLAMRKSVEGDRSGMGSGRHLERVESGNRRRDRRGGPQWTFV